MHPSIANTSSEMNISLPPFILDPSNPNYGSSNFHRSPSVNSNKTSSNNLFSYSDLISPSASTSSLNYMDLLRTWNYHQFLTSSLKTDQVSDNSSSDYHSRNGSFHQHNPRLLEKPSFQQTDDEYILGKFHHDTLVNLDTGESKNIQQLTTNDFLISAKQNQQYSRLNYSFIFFKYKITNLFLLI